MKTRLLVMVGVMISTTIFAQKATRDSRKPENTRFERMKRELALSDNQYASIRGIDSRYDKKFGEQRAKFDKRRLEEREAMRSLRLEREREMRKVFTPAQSKKWDEYRAAQKARHNFHKNKHAGHRKHVRKDGREKRDSLKRERN